MNKKPVICILLGDAAGIGPELVAKVCASGFAAKHAHPVILGDKRVLDHAMTITSSRFSYAIPDSMQNWQPQDGEITLLDQKDLDPGDIETGAIDSRCGQAVVDMIRKASELYKQGVIDGLCFAPFNKAAIKEAGYTIESEQDLFVEYFGSSGLVGEMNVVEGLWTSRVTSHIPLGDIRGHLSFDKILDAIRLAHRTVRSSGIESPRIAVCALNPHAGENGTCGREEIEMIIPAAQAAKEEGMDIQGVFPADTIFIDAFRGKYDIVVTLYHDQGQIALKLKDFRNAVTIEAGLPLPITTPAHGTAYDIAGKGIASTSSFEAAYNIVTTSVTLDPMRSATY